MKKDKKNKGNYKLVEVPEVSDATMAFPGRVSGFDRILQEAQQEGFTGSLGSQDYWENRFSDLFFKGGSLNPNKKVSEEERNKLIRYFKACARSFAPKHEHKTAVCAYILRTLEGEKK